jgi:hypothetical protein
MKRSSTAWLGILALFVLTSPLAAGPVRAEEGRVFAFDYGSGEPLVYETKLEMGVEMLMKTGGQEIPMSMAMVIRYDLQLAAEGAAADGATSLLLEPKSIAVDWDISAPNGETEMHLRNGEMTGTQNGTVFIDTAEGIGVAQANEVKKELAGVFLTGHVDLTPRGEIAEFRGSVPFVDFWEEASAAQLGFFSIVFPEEPIAVGESWTETLVLERMGTIRLGEGGMRCDTTFTRLPDEDVDGTTVSRFRASAPFDHQNIRGFVESLSGNMPMNFRSFERNATGTISFDPARGALVDAEMSVDATAAAVTTVQGQSIDMDLEIDGGVSMELVSGP